MIKRSLLVLGILTSFAHAQPGAMPSGDAPPAPAVGVDGQGVDLDALIARAEASVPTLESVAVGTFNRARRSISVGPTVGLWSAAIVDPGEIDAALTFGIGVETFKVPVLPDMNTIKALIQERLKAQLKERIKDVLKGRPPQPMELDQIAAQVYGEVRDEILGQKNVRAKTMERPRFSVGFEANRVFGAERWLGRTRVGLGVWKLTLGISAAVGRVCRGPTCDDGLKFFSGPEVVLHFLTSKKPRASVVDAFMRFDLQASGRGTAETYDQLVLGARFLLDVI